MPFIVKYGILLLLLHMQVCLWEFVCKWLPSTGNTRDIVLHYYKLVDHIIPK